MKMKKIVLVLFILVVVSLFIVGCEEETEVEEMPKEVSTENISEKVSTEKVPVKEESTELPSEEKTDEEVLIAQEETKEEIVKSKTHDVKIKLTEFDPNEITINVGDTVEWENVREGNLHLAMVIGAQKCTIIKSEVLDTGETFSWTFENVETCTVIDAITTTQIMKVHVE